LADMFSSWGMTRYGIRHALDIGDRANQVNAYLTSIDSHVTYQPQAYEPRTMPTFNELIADIEHLREIWAQDISTATKLRQLTTPSGDDTQVPTPEQLTRQTFYILLEAEGGGVLGNSREDYTATMGDSNLQKGLIDVMAVLQDSHLLDSVVHSFEGYQSMIEFCTHEGTLDQTCYDASRSASIYPSCTYGSMADLVYGRECVNEIVITPQMRQAGITRADDAILLLFRVIVMLSTDSGTELVATLVTDILGSQQSIFYHLPEVNLALLAINDPTPTYDYEPDSTTEVVIEPGASVNFHFAGEPSDLGGVWLDGQRLSSSQYVASDGSIRIALASDLVQNLGDGDHTFGIGLNSTHQIYTLQFHVTRPPQPAPLPSNQNVPNHARASEAAKKTCALPAPVGVADLFQIDRRADQATIYFTPVTDYTDRYHVVFGHNVGDERYGGIALPVNRQQNNGVLAIDITNLDPSQEYSFQVIPANDCAIGQRSNWLTAKGVSRSSRSTVKTYRQNSP